MNNRNLTIDLLKGWLIYAVVLGHTIQVFNIDYDEVFLFKLIYSFHMPFFFLISGYLAADSLQNRGCGFQYCVIKKFLYLVIPFLLWYIVFYFQSEIDFAQYISSLVYGVDNGLWYLWILFMMYVILWISSTISSKKNFYFWIFFFMILIPNQDLLGFKYLKWYLIFFLIGMILVLYKKNLLKYEEWFKNDKLLFVVSLSFILSVYFLWYRNYIPSYLFPNQYIFMGVKLFVAIMGIYTFYSLVTKIGLLQKVFIEDIGKNSLGIYILNLSLLHIISNYYVSNNLFSIIFLSILVLFLSHCLSLYLAKVKYISILFGLNRSKSSLK